MSRNPPASWRPQPVAIVGALKSRLNVLAHAAAVKQEALLREDLTLRLRAAAQEGATLADLHAILDRFEQSQKDIPQ